MTPKSPQPLSSSHRKVPKQVKTEKNVMTLLEKIHLLDKLESHQSFAQSAPSSAKVAANVRDTATVKMEKALNIWIEDFNRCHIPLSQKFICDKAKVLYDRFHAEEDCTSFIQQCHNDLAALCVNSCWRALWPEVVNDFAGFPTVDQDSSLPVKREVRGINEFQEEEVQEELLGHDGKELTEEELAELVEEQCREDEEEEGEVEEVPTLNVTGLNRFLLASRALVDMLFETDPSFE
ncbi:putative Tigger transposable element-derived protein 1-like 267, partial [Homarus americanus]